MTTPSPQAWTIRLKAHKTTVLLHVDPLESFSSIKAQLYDALHETGIKHRETNERLELPSSPADIQLGRPINVNDASEGFQLGEWEYPAGDDNGDETSKAKGKAKAVVKKSNGEIKDIIACPKGAGMRDGAVLPFRWVGDGFWDGDDEDAHLQDDKRRGGEAPDMWGVQLASFEDAYGVDNEADVGGGREFEG